MAFSPAIGPSSRPSSPSTALPPFDGWGAPPPRAAEPVDRYVPLDPAIAQSGGIFPQQLKPGSLIVLDQHMPSSMDPMPPHGAMVRGAAEQAGFKGPVVQGLFGIGKSPEEARLAARMREPDCSPDEFRQLLKSTTVLAHRGLLNEASERLEGLTNLGAKNSAANLSVGNSKASTLRSVLMDDVETRNNAARMLGLSVDRLESSDPKISGPENLKLQQGVLGVISEAVDGSPEIKASKARYDKAVQGFEQGGNSLVVSAGNDGRVPDQLAKLAHGQRIALPADFEDNVLSNPQVTLVGALDGNNVAVYSSRDRQVDVYAQGTILGDAQGTSFASPRVAATMARLHQQNPKMTSAQVEQLMKQKLTSPLLQPGNHPPAPALEVDKTRRFLGSRTF